MPNITQKVEQYERIEMDEDLVMFRLLEMMDSITPIINNSSKDYLKNPIWVLNNTKLKTQGCRKTKNTYYSNQIKYFSKKPEKFLYKYVAKMSDAISDIENQSLHFNNPDSFDCNDTSFENFKKCKMFDYAEFNEFVSEELSKCDEFKEKIFNRKDKFDFFTSLKTKMSICCLTENDDDPYMWKEYADNGKGVCLVIDTSKLTINPYKIQYIDYNEEAFSNIFKNHITTYDKSNNESIFYSVVSEMILTLYRKPKGFCKESEWRMYTGTLKNPHDMVFPNAICGVITGPNYHENQNLIDACKDKFSITESKIKTWHDCE